ncbi:MAG: ImmA/IrrE family metallo-endopeptidase [Lamprobacter sp.]|uniref:ImmA/IrrE family metallo-endopeptidase n=1 Tax=Lamprobacter sp. TaxID=3100796 RepID=UPI002B25E8BB|nr:ImmA/IrrE family metallo-endopeptidase [Lamprobacter sp.]MEA3643721.1 ImmA/IrrE family metallo-endopeptidase [Lamprobacter sp.]
MAQALQLGSDSGIQMWVLPADGAQAAHGLAEAWFSLSVAGTPIWGDTSGAPTPLADAQPWPLVDFLHGLARIWPWLIHEQGYPINIVPLHPGFMMQEAEARWRDLAVGQAEAEEDLLFGFRQRHDLSLLFRGLTIRPLWLLREGWDAQLWSPALECPRSLPHAQAMSDLAAIGDALDRLLETSLESRALSARQGWSEREQRVAEHFLPITTGLDLGELRLLAGAGDIANDQRLYDWFEVQPGADRHQHPGELLMAARMTGASVGAEQQHGLLQAIRAIPSVATPNLDALAEQATQVIQMQAPAYEQGYQLAQWLRQRLGISSDQRVYTDQILRQWGLIISEIDLAAGIDAVAVWGERHGPAVLLNINHRSCASTANGRRSTLAHEICHLLVDRAHALPVAEVLGGQVPRGPEQRANAFAAEFLLPREQVEQRCRAQSDLLLAAADLEETFQVSRTLTLHQINNSALSRLMSAAELKRLDRWAL